MNTRCDEFRAHAEECRKLASHVPGSVKQQYEELERQWLELAERVERQGERARVAAA
jgi:hypothetical protein